MTSNRETLLRQSCAARDTFWNEWGDVDPDVLAPLVNPAFQGLPAWPALRQAYRAVRRGTLTLVATDGLSDPFDDPSRADAQGFGLEFFAVTKDALPPMLNQSWLLDLVFQAGLNATDHGGFRAILDKEKLVSMQLFDVRVPDEWLDADGGVGVLLNLQDLGRAGVPGSAELPLEKTLIVNVQLLTQPELTLVLNNGARGRIELARRLIDSGDGQRSSLSRRSVV